MGPWQHREVDVFRALQRLKSSNRCMVATGKLSAKPTRQRPTSSLGLTPSWPKAD
jgi:hypothetical protein